MKQKLKDAVAVVTLIILLSLSSFTAPNESQARPTHWLRTASR